MIAKFLTTILVVAFLAFPVASWATTLHWTPPTTGSYDGFRVTMDDNVLIDLTQETSLNIDDQNLIEGQTYTFRVYTVDTLSDTMELVSPPHVLTYTHRSQAIETVQDIAAPPDSHVVIDINVNINQ